MFGKFKATWRYETINYAARRAYDKTGRTCDSIISVEKQTTLVLSLEKPVNEGRGTGETCNMGQL